MALECVWRRARAALAAGLVASSVGSAHAQGRVLGPAGGAPQVDALRVAVAQSVGRTTLWASYRLNSPVEHAAIVLPVAPGAVVDPASDAWFEALEDATAPRVVPPSGYSPASCGPGTPTSMVDNTADAAPAPTLPPSAVAVESTLNDLMNFASSHGFALGTDAQSALGNVGGPFLVLSYELPGGVTLTQPVRIVEPATTSLPLALVHATLSAPVSVTLWTLGSGRARVSGADELATSDLNVVWHALAATSTYRAARSQALAVHNGQAWLLEASGTAPLFTWTPVAASGVTIAPAVTAYLQHAKALGDISGDPQTCQTVIDQARASGDAVASACPSGLLARVPDPTQSFVACPPKPAGDVDPSQFECGSADDVAFALSGLVPDTTWVTREAGWMTDQSPASSQLDISSGATRSPVVMAPTVDFSGCSGPLGGTGGTGGTSGWDTGGSGYGAYGGSSGGRYGAGGASGGDTSGWTYEPSTSTNVSTGLDCSGSTTSSSCSGDSSSSSSSDGSTCSGDSSSSQSSSSCSGDSSSSSSSSDGSTCSGDSSSSSSSDGSTCSGDSSSSSSGSTCSGDSSSSSSGCSLVRLHGHPRLSALALGWVAFVFPLRRWRRRRWR